MKLCVDLTPEKIKTKAAFRETREGTFKYPPQHTVHLPYAPVVKTYKFKPGTYNIIPCTYRLGTDPPPTPRLRSHSVTHRPGVTIRDPSMDDLARRRGYLPHQGPLIFTYRFILFYLISRRVFCRSTGDGVIQALVVASTTYPAGSPTPSCTWP